MIRPINLFRLLGVDISIDISFIPLFIVAWFHWGYQGSISAFLWGCLLIVLAFLSVLAQELGHALMARENGVQVLDVSISPLAGVAKVEQASTSPRAELMIALAGPAVNLAIFVTLLPIVLIIAVLAGADSLFGVGDGFRNLNITSIVAATAVFNLGLAIFNLIPAFPLDGGRVLRAYLSTRMSRHSATVIASRIGVGIAVLLIAIGVIQREYLLPLLGAFILWAAFSEVRIVRIEDQMQRLLVGSYALWDGGGISPEVPLSFALRGGPRDMVVTQRGRVVGMLWRNRLLEHLDGGVAGRIVADIMEDPLYIADVSESLWDVQRHMSEHNTRAIPVTEKGLYRGVFSADRFLNLYRQIAPGLQERDWEINEEWREAVLANFQRWTRRK
ncbi:MAG: site-2 protease family protein [Thermomicrobiales bacterium]|nr:site-2 protease family protein [Thermomicrobiales bacterium]MCO5219115.1 site-2 protease family protein [Thermomicrobiales bacterium]MCO5225421.1 site-2 protease family protein [Thermomicrobiales bacterium]